MAGLFEYAADTCLLELVKIDKDFVKEGSNKDEILERLKTFVKDYLKPILIETDFQAAIETLTEN